MRICSCERLNIGGCLITQESSGAAYLLLGYISAVAAEVGIEGQHLHAHSTDNARPPSLLRFCGLVEYCTAKHGTRSLLICELVSHWSAASSSQPQPLWRRICEPDDGDFVSGGDVLPGPAFAGKRLISGADC